LSDVNTSGAANNAVLKFDGTNWVVGTDNTGSSYTEGAGIDINGTEIAAENDNSIWNASKIQGRDVTTSTPSNGSILKWNGSQWGLANDDMNTYSAGSGLSLNGSTFSANSSTPMWNASSIQGNSVTGVSPSNGEILKWNGSTWALSTDDNTSYSSGTGISIASGTISANSGTALWNANQIQGRTVNTSAPSSGDVLKWNGSDWSPAADNGQQYSAGTGISISSGTISASSSSALWNASQIQGRNVSSTAPTSGQVLKWNGSNWAPANDSSGGGSSSSVWSKSGNIIYSGSSDNVGINRTNPTSRLHVWDSITSGSGVSLLADYRLYPSPASNAGGWVVREVGDINSSAEIIGNLAVTTGSSTVSGATAYGVLAIAGSEADNSYGLYTVAEESDVRNYGVYSYSNGTGTFNIGGFFLALRNSSNSNYGVYAVADSASTALSGYFDGDLTYTGTLTGPSDKFLKKNIETMPTALSKVMKLQPKTYAFDKSQTTMNLPEGEQFGFLAQDLQEVFPNLVHKQKHIENPTEKKEDIITKEYNSVDYMSLIPVLTKALQEQQVMIEELKKEVEELKSQK